MKEMWTYLENYSRSIEINYITRDKDELLTKVYFQFAPIVSPIVNMFLCCVKSLS